MKGVCKDVVEYRIDRRSGVATYLQIVQQTKQALRLGLLEPGDRLPTAREVVEATAINRTRCSPSRSASAPNSSSRTSRWPTWTLPHRGHPHARHQLMGTPMADAAEHGTTVVMSSHILGEPEGACDHLFLLDGGRIRLGGGIDDILGARPLVTGPVADLSPHTVMEARTTGRRLTALVRREGPLDHRSRRTMEPTPEELLFGHLRWPGAPPLLTPGAEGGECGMSAPTTARAGRVVVRQHRRAPRVTLALLALAAAVTAGLREWVAGSMDEARCLAGEPEACGAQLFGDRVTPQGFLALVLQWSLFALMAVPPLLGAFVAGPMVAREPESGTHQVAWTQSVTPARRLAANLLLAAALAAGTAAVLTAVFRFARKPVLFHENLGWADRGAYEAMGPALGAYCLPGVAVGASRGCWSPYRPRHGHGGGRHLHAAAGHRDPALGAPADGARERPRHGPDARPGAPAPRRLPAPLRLRHRGRAPPPVRRVPAARHRDAVPPGRHRPVRRLPPRLGLPARPAPGDRGRPRPGCLATYAAFRVLRRHCP